VQLGYSRSRLNYIYPVESRSYECGG